jgi:TRAP-type C4-dicarboxylate transport system permease small subunit
MSKWIAILLKIGTLISTAGFIGSMLIQVYARFFMSSAPSWTEEASRFFFLYAMGFASGLAFKDSYYVHLDVFYDKMKDSHKRLLDISIPIAVIVLFLILGIYAIEYVILGIPEGSPSLGMSMSIAFTSIVIMSFSISFFAFHELKTLLKKKL